IESGSWHDHATYQCSGRGFAIEWVRAMNDEIRLDCFLAGLFWIKRRPAAAKVVPRSVLRAQMVKERRAYIGILRRAVGDGMLVPHDEERHCACLQVRVTTTRGFYPLVARPLINRV